MRALMANASSEPNASTCTEWSITRSAGTCGLMAFGSPPSVLIASRIAARSTTAGTPVRSCSSTRAGMKAISVLSRSGEATPAEAGGASPCPGSPVALSPCGGSPLALSRCGAETPAAAGGAGSQLASASMSLRGTALPSSRRSRFSSRMRSENGSRSTWPTPAFASAASR